MRDRAFVSIIIRAYNEEKSIGKLLSLIKKQKTDFEYEIILVDSGSTDNTLRIAESFNIKILKINPNDFSFGYSLNKGIERAEGDFCVFISAHCFPTNERWLSEIIKPFKNNEKIGLVYGKQRGGGNSKYSEKEVFIKWYPDDREGIQNHPFCNNANSAIRKKLWNKIKYNESLTGLEDIDWAKKIIEKGYLIYYNPKAEILHIHNETWAQIYNRYKREAMTFYKLFPEQKFGFLSFVKYFIWNSIIDIIHSIIKGKFVFSEILLYRYNQFKGTYDGSKHKENITKELKNIFYYPNKINRR